MVIQTRNIITVLLFELFENSIFLVSNLATNESDAHKDNRIINGTAVDIKLFPYQLSFRFRASHMCGAAIISENVGLTAAHCFNGHHHVSLYSVLAGVSNLSDEKNGQVRPLSKFIKHPKFNQITHRNDIAVFSFKQPLEFGKTIAAIRLPPPNKAVAKSGAVAGWGLTRENNMTSAPDSLRQVVKTTITNELCDTLYTNKIRITHQMFCTHDFDAGIDACTGDDGGAYASGNYIYGIISWAYRCAHSKFPRVHTRVPSYIDWIKKNANITIAV